MLGDTWVGESAKVLAVAVVLHDVPPAPPRPFRLHL
jgi:serine acetyltransferase